MDDPSILLGRTLVLAAHPDDEAIGCGVLLQRMREPLVCFATDGGPADPWFWKDYGSREAYVETRAREARAALGGAGIHHIHWLENDGRRIPDQQLFRMLPQAYASLWRLVDGLRLEALVTHAYQGGHPDHDSCSFLASRLARERNLPVWEFPLYHRSAEAMVYQRYLPREGESPGEHVIDPTPDESARKRRMIEAYRSQAGVLRDFPSGCERFRPQPAYDYSRPPHSGRLCYEAWEWPMRGVEVSHAFTAFRPIR